MRTLPQSRGGMGIILKTASMTLMLILAVNIITRGLKTLPTRSAGISVYAGSNAYFKSKKLTTASNKLVTGPAAADIAISLLGFLKL
jgi:hypothetical protein